MSDTLIKRKALIVTAFYNYDFPIRVKYLYNYLQRKGFSVKILSSDFDHRTKKYYQPDNKNLELIHVPEYKKNLSISRILSHIVFANSCRSYCSREKPDLVYAITPPNFLFKSLSSLKTTCKNTKLIFEIEDLWPETLPIDKKFRKLMAFPLFVWKAIRNRNIRNCDAIICECDLFKEYLQKENFDNKIKTIYLSKEDVRLGQFSSIKGDSASFLYLGSINNLIDIKLIVEILSAVRVSRPTALHIIGSGEQKQQLVNLCRKHDIKVIDHGNVYDEREKEIIMYKCHYAFNVMKDSVFVGATMKSLEYFHYGMPILNNIMGDTSKIVEQYKCGYNIDRSNINELALKIQRAIDDGELIKQSRNSRSVYEIKFIPEVFLESIEEVVNDIYSNSKYKDYIKG